MTPGHEAGAVDIARIGGSPDAGIPASSPGGTGTTRLDLSGPVQLHIHLGAPASSPAVPAGAVVVQGPGRRRPFLMGLLGLALAGGGYWAGSARVAPATADAVAGPLAGAGSALPSPPGLPPLAGVPGEMSPEMRRLLDRPPAVIPPPGAPPGAKAAAVPVAGPVAGAVPPPAGRNPFGLGN